MVDNDRKTNLQSKNQWSGNLQQDDLRLRCHNPVQKRCLPSYFHVNRKLVDLRVKLVLPVWRRDFIIKSTVMTRYAKGSPNTKNLLKIEENKPKKRPKKIRINAKNIYLNLLTSPRFSSQMLHFHAEFPYWSSVAKILMIFPAPLLAGPDDRCPTEMTLLQILRCPMFHNLRVEQ